ncbi:MAG: hypothetical protein Q8N09_08305 [Thermodesulfovibrionia bacterium]|nr:hypothetical protein [Thermodesulfovibrionia bacterium]
MKKLLSIMTVAVLIIGTAMSAWAIIEGTPHDVAVMRDLGAGADIERCAMCHTPHAGSGQYPLWNRAQGAPTSYTMYASPTFDMTETTLIDSANYATFNCMVCHNGVASTLVNYPGPGSVANTDYNFNSTLLVNPQTNLGSDAATMLNEHPVGFTYNPARDDENNGFRAAQAYSTSNVNKRAIIGARGPYPLYSETGNTGDYNQFECATCHAVHDTVDYPGKSMDVGRSAGTQVYFLRGDNSGSGMCIDCHVNR